jgi:hypothetical protein
MSLIKEAKWMCENSKSLERYAGRWVAFLPEQGIVGCAASLSKALAKAARLKDRKQPFVFHVPTLEELRFPLTTPRLR